MHLPGADTLGRACAGPLRLHSLPRVAVPARTRNLLLKVAGKINKVTIVRDPPKLTPEDVQKLEAAASSASD